LDQTAKDVRSEYNALEYRTLLSEELFVHDTYDIPGYQGSPKVKRVTTMADSDKIKTVRRNRKAIRDVDLDAALPEHYLYAVFDGHRACGWVGSVPFGDSSWIADLYVLPEYRGKGYGRALMSAVTKEDKERGVKRSVLLASAAGARLYPHIGYKHIGTLQLFCPKRN
jgi:ribosomal protein S18 acetylase RimI-like enzyme